MLLVLAIFLTALALAWASGMIARGRGPIVFWSLAVFGVVMLFVLPLVYEARVFDGNCYQYDGTSTPCTLEERMWSSFIEGFGFTIPPAIMWLVVYVVSARQVQ